MTGRMQLWSISLALMLSGCVVVPGSHMDLGHQAPSNDAAVDFSGKLNVQAITPELVSQFKRQPVAIPEPNPDLDRAIQGYDYRIGPGDVLNVMVWDHPELNDPMALAKMTLDMTGDSSSLGTSSDASGSSSGGSGSSGTGSSSTTSKSPYIPGIWVDADGSIFYPYVGVLKVAGLKRSEVRSLLRDRLSHYLTNPQLDVTIMAYHAQHVYVTGEVKQPSTLPITNMPMTLLDAINQAGGLAADGDWKNIVLTRNRHEYHYSLRDLYQHGDIRQNILLQPNDLLFIPPAENDKVFVLGEVVKAQIVLMNPNGLTLAEALTASGGINELTSKASGIFVLRRRDDAKSGKLVDVYQLNAQDATALILADAFPLQQRDIVFVTGAPVTRWNRVVSQLLASIDVLYLESQTNKAGL